MLISLVHKPFQTDHYQIHWFKDFFFNLYFIIPPLCHSESALNKEQADSLAGTFFGQDVSELGSSAALQCGVGNIHVNEAGDLRYVTKSILHNHHVVASTWRGVRMTQSERHKAGKTVLLFLTDLDILRFFSSPYSAHHICF